MGKIYEDANDQHVTFTIYKKTGETKAYKDSACTVQYTTSELNHAVLRGAVIVLEDGSIKLPIGYAVSSSIGSVSYIVPNGTAETSADIASLVAVADPS